MEGLGLLPHAYVYRVNGGPVPKNGYRDLLRADPCTYCGEPTEPRDEERPESFNPRAGTVEHLTRRADARGLNENIVGACQGCNSGRLDRSPLEVLLKARL